MSRTLALLLSLALFGTTIGCVRHLAYPGRMDVIEAPTPEVWQYRVLRMRIARSDEELSPKRRNQLGRTIARVVESRTRFEQVLPFSKSQGYADRAPVLELDLYRYEMRAFESGEEVGLEGEGRLIAPDARVLGRFELEASNDSDWLSVMGLRVRDDAPDDRFELIARRTAGHVAEFINAVEEGS